MSSVESRTVLFLITTPSLILTSVKSGRRLAVPGDVPITDGPDHAQLDYEFCTLIMTKTDVRPKAEATRSRECEWLTLTGSF